MEAWWIFALIVVGVVLWIVVWTHTELSNRPDKPSELDYMLEDWDDD